MSYLELAKRAEARLRAAPKAERPYEVDGRNEGNREAPRSVAEACALLAMSLPDFVATGQPVEFLVPWLPDTLWIVPTERDLAALVAEGVSRGRIWTAAELLQLVAVATTDGEHGLRIVARAKLEFGGEIVAVMTRRRPGPSDRGRPEAH